MSSFTTMRRILSTKKMAIIDNESRPSNSCSQTSYNLSDAEMNTLLAREYVEVLFHPRIRVKLPPTESETLHKHKIIVKSQPAASNMSPEPNIDFKLPPTENPEFDDTPSMPVESNGNTGLSLGLGITVTTEYGFEEDSTPVTVVEREVQPSRKKVPPTPDSESSDSSSEEDAGDDTMSFSQDRTTGFPEDVGNVYLEDILEIERQHPDDEAIGDDEEMGDVDLDDLLELEREHADDINLDGNVPNTITPSSSTQIYSPAPQSPRPKFKEWRAIGGSLEEDDLEEEQEELPDLEMLFTHTMITYSDYCLRVHPTLGRYRARDPSRLRKCWTRLTREQLDTVDGD
jgi:hypothetical protein